MTADGVVQIARKWLGTPFRHQGALLGVGVDCAHLLESVGEEAGLLPPGRSIPTYAYEPPDGLLRSVVAEHLDEVPVREAKVGDVALITVKGREIHGGLLTDVGLLHAFATVGKVCEHPIDDRWRRRITGAFRWRGLDG